MEYLNRKGKLVVIDDNPEIVCNDCGHIDSEKNFITKKGNGIFRLGLFRTKKYCPKCNSKKVQII